LKYIEDRNDFKFVVSDEDVFETEESVAKKQKKLSKEYPDGLDYELILYKEIHK
jgi:hypothetical protein